MKKIWIWLMVFIFVEVILLSEKNIPREIADLEKRLNSVTGKAKVDLLNQLSGKNSRNEPQKTIDYARQALTLSRDLKYPGGEARAYINLGLGYSIKGENYQESLEYYHQGLKWFEKKEDQKQIADIYNKIGIVYKFLSRYQEALPYLEQCLKIAENIKAQNLLLDHYYSISHLYEEIGNPKKALEYFKLYQQADKKIFNETKSQQITRLQTQYETEKKELKINALEREKRIQSLQNRVKTIIAGSLLLILMLLAIVIYRSYKKYKIEACQKEEKLRNLQQETRLKLFLAGIDKHFLFNSLDSIIGLEKIPDQLKDNLKKLSDLYRYILISFDRLVIPLKEELEAVKNYLEIEQKILKGRLLFEIPEVEAHLLACEILPQSLLTLVENAVKHGIYQKENGGTVFIDIQKKNKSLIIEVIDTGAGIQQGVINTGFGLYSVRERLKLYYKNKAMFSIKERTGGGTRAIMEVPYVSSCS